MTIQKEPTNDNPNLKAVMHYCVGPKVEDKLFKKIAKSLNEPVNMLECHPKDVIKTCLKFTKPNLSFVIISKCDTPDKRIMLTFDFVSISTPLTYAQITVNTDEEIASIKMMIDRFFGDYKKTGMPLQYEDSDRFVDARNI